MMLRFGVGNLAYADVHRYSTWQRRFCSVLAALPVRTHLILEAILNCLLSSFCLASRVRLLSALACFNGGLARESIPNRNYESKQAVRSIVRGKAVKVVDLGLNATTPVGWNLVH